jgi:hypothetical protein
VHDRQAGERQCFAGREQLIGLLRSGERLFRGHGDEGIERGVEALDPREEMPCELDARKPARTQTLVELRERQAM